MTRVTQNDNFENELDTMTGAFFKSFKVSSHLRASSAYKQSGIAVINSEYGLLRKRRKSC
jgi:hypothetical protein